MKRIAFLIAILTCQTLYAGFFRDVLDQTILGKGFTYPSCDTQELSEKEFSEQEFRELRAKYIRKEKHCKLAKLTFDLYLQNPDLYNEFGRMLPALKALKDGGHFMDFAWEFRNFEEAYGHSKDREKVHYWRVQTYLDAIPQESHYCTRPLGYYLNKRNKRNDIGTEAAIIFKTFEKDWPESEYLKESEKWWQQLATYETNYAVCTSEGRFLQWKNLSKRKRQPGPLIAAYQDLARSIARDQASPELDKTLYWTVKILSHLSAYQNDDSLPEHLRVAADGNWTQKREKIFNLMETHFSESEWTDEARELMIQ